MLQTGLTDTDIDRGRQPLGAQPVEVLEFAAGAGGGAKVDQEPRAGVVWFRRDWLPRLGLDPALCVMLRGEGGPWSLRSPKHLCLAQWLT